jgi:cytochrome c oxidase subunit 2
MSRVPWMPENGALHGIALDHLMGWNLFALTILFVLAHILLAVALFRRNPQKSQPQLTIPKTLALLALCALYIWMAITGQRLWAMNRFEGPSPAAMQVEVVGVQFQWYFRYPGQDAAFGIARPELVNAAAGNPLGLDPVDTRGHDDIVSSILVLPAGREVDLRLRAQDVIHGFFIPSMRLKENAVPGLLLHVHFTPQMPGTYPILCSQVCGLGHARMQARLLVLPQPEYEKWIAAREHARLSEASVTHE